ncbi:MAG: hypothetical protein WA973_18080 [Mesorhizobium sp.]
MAVQISTLRIAPEIDATKYVGGASQIDAADKAMVAGKQAVAQAYTATDAKISTSGDVLARLSRQYIEGYNAQQRFSQGLGQLSRGLETGKISIEGAERILVGMNQRLGLTANAAELAAKGQTTLAAAVERANVQIARQANDLTAADAANRRMQAANSNTRRAGASQFAAFNSAQQIQDILVSSQFQSVPTIALQQGLQLGSSLQMSLGESGATGIVKALGGAVTSLLSPVNLLAIGFTAAAAAAVKFGSTVLRDGKSIEDILKRHKEVIDEIAAAYPLAAQAATAYEEAAKKVPQSVLAADTAQQMEDEKRKLTSLLDDIGTRLRVLGTDYGLFGTAGSEAFSQLSKDIDAGSASASEIQRRLGELRLDPALSQYARDFAASLQDAANQASTLESKLGGTNAAAAVFKGVTVGRGDEGENMAKWLAQNRGALRQLQIEQSLALQQLYARSPSELAAAARAVEQAKPVDGHESSEVRRLREDNAAALAYAQAMKQITEAAHQRSEALDRSLAQQRLELDLIGKTGGEQAKLRFEFERMQELRDQAARTGGPIDDKEVAAIKAAAEEMGKYADALARAKLADDLQFERDQLFRSPLDQQIASRLRGTGIGLNSPEAQMMRDNQYFADVKGIVTGFLSDFEAGLMDSGGDIGKALGRAVLGGLNSILDKIISNLFDQIGTSIASSITGVTGGGAGAGGSLLGDIGKALMGGSRGANDNYAPGAITRAALPNIGGGSSSDAVGLASGLLGLNENTSASQINSFLRAGGVNLDAASQAWCAAFVNSSLKQIGVDGSGSSVATSFLNWGQSVNPADVLRGDVLVQSRGLAAGQIGGHVGFATGATRMFGGQQQLQMLSGNTSDQVGLGWYNASEISVRRAETALDKLTTTSTQAVGGIGRLGQAGSQATQGLGTFASTLSQFQAAGGAAPTGWNGVLGSLFGGATGWGAAGNWLAANPGGFIGLWDEGGFTGPGGKHDVAGIVHKGEYVLDADTVMRAGGPHVLDGLRRGLRGYADGGFVGAPMVPVANQNSRSAPVVNINVINNAGASVQTQERQEPDGSMTLDVIVDRVVADKLNTRGTATNNTLRQGFGAQQALKRR